MKLADFGVATKLTEADVNTHSVVGTPYWMAPEVLLLSFNLLFLYYYYYYLRHRFMAIVAFFLFSNFPFFIPDEVLSIVATIQGACDAEFRIVSKEYMFLGRRFLNRNCGFILELFDLVGRVVEKHECL